MDIISLILLLRYHAHPLFYVCFYQSIIVFIITKRFGSYITTETFGYYKNNYWLVKANHRTMDVTLTNHSGLFYHAYIHLLNFILWARLLPIGLYWESLWNCLNYIKLQETRYSALFFTILETSVGKCSFRRHHWFYYKWTRSIYIKLQELQLANSLAMMKIVIRIDYAMQLYFTLILLLINKLNQTETTK